MDSTDDMGLNDTIAERARDRYSDNIRYDKKIFIKRLLSGLRGIVMLSEKYNFQKIASALDTFSPFDLAEVDGEYVVRIALFRGTFPFHTHPKDEFFLVLEGSFSLDTKESKNVLKQGECITARAGLEHRPSCEKDAIVLTVMHKTIRTSKANFPEVKDKL